MEVFKFSHAFAKFKRIIPYYRAQEEKLERQRNVKDRLRRKLHEPVEIQDLYFPRDYTGGPPIPCPGPWATKASEAAVSSAARLSAYKQERRQWIESFGSARMSGKLKFRKNRVKGEKGTRAPGGADQMTTTHNHHHHPDAHDHSAEEKKRITCHRQFRHWCQHTSLHGWNYLAEKRRSKFELCFWVCWCLFGIMAAAYMMSKIWAKWERNPIITSVATTNHPVQEVVFPAVTICTVNKAATEKLIIQGCRYNLTLTQMRAIISILVDPDARNNDLIDVDKNFVKPEVALKYLRLVAPKCDDFLLSCRWNSAPAQCTQLFRLVLTDNGYCCSFNGIETKKQRKESKHDYELMIQEQEYNYLQRAVWEYTDNFRKNPMGNVEDNNMTSEATDSFNCVREYDDDLFPGICDYLRRCRDSAKCRERNRVKSNATSQKPIGSLSAKPFNFFAENFPLKVAGAGRSRGLTLMLDTLRCDTVPTDSFKGLRVFVHNADDFPAVAERGFIVGPGMETQIGVTAVDTYSKDVLRRFHPSTRGCFFPDEFPLKFYKEYSRSACIVECETEFIQKECKCVMYYSPGNYSICTLKTYTECVKKALDTIQKKTVPVGDGNSGGSFLSSFNFKSQQKDDEKSCGQFCLPSCNETFYNVFATAADFPNQPLSNQTKMLREAIEEGGHKHLSDIKYVSGSISVLRIFFRESSIMQYKRDELFTWEDFVSNIGGVLGLCMGFSLLSLVEVIYFFTFRTYMDKRKWKEHMIVAERIS